MRYIDTKNRYTARYEISAAGSGTRAKYLVYPTPANTPAGYSGNR